MANHPVHAVSAASASDDDTPIKAHRACILALAGIGQVTVNAVAPDTPSLARHQLTPYLKSDQCLG